MLLSRSGVVTVADTIVQQGSATLFVHMWLALLCGVG